MRNRTPSLPKVKLGINLSKPLTFSLFLLFLTRFYTFLDASFAPFAQTLL